MGRKKKEDNKDEVVVLEKIEKTKSSSGVSEVFYYLLGLVIGIVLIFATEELLSTINFLFVVIFAIIAVVQLIGFIMDKKYISRDYSSLIIGIIKRAKNKILIIDNYIDDSILEMLQKKNKNVEVIILTIQNNKLTKLDIQKFNKQYPTLKIAYTNKFHDRFIVIDNKELYHCGASLKDLGKKCFAISKIEDIEYIEKISCVEEVKTQ